MAEPEALLVVRHGTNRIGVDMAEVREILRMVMPTLLPGSPRGVLGVMNLRGETIPVLDLEERLPAGAGKPGVGHHLVIAESEGRALAIAVTHVEGIEPVPPGAYRRASEVLPSGVVLRGVARLGEELVPVLDTVALLDEREILALDKAIALFRTAT